MANLQWNQPKPSGWVSQVKHRQILERIALVLYQSGAKGKSLTDFQWRTDDHEWYLGMARKVVDTMCKSKWRAVLMLFRGVNH
jgi:hypothetical protein